MNSGIPGTLVLSETAHQEPHLINTSYPVIKTTHPPCGRLTRIFHSFNQHLSHDLWGPQVLPNNMLSHVVSHIGVLFVYKEFYLKNPLRLSEDEKKKSP